MKHTFCYLTLVFGLFYLPINILSSVSSIGRWHDISKYDQSKKYTKSVFMIRSASYHDHSGIHSCYELRELNSNSSTAQILRSFSFCYPAIVITGVPKCSTSALYNMLESYPNTIRIQLKENCPYDGSMKRASLFDFFQTLPRTIGKGKILIDGCLRLQVNMHVRAVLRKPNTFYLVSLW